jgi:hypothetical protein
MPLTKAWLFAAPLSIEELELNKYLFTLTKSIRILQQAPWNVHGSLFMGFIFLVQGSLLGYSSNTKAWPTTVSYVDSKDIAKFLSSLKYWTLERYGFFLKATPFSSLRTSHIIKYFEDCPREPEEVPTNLPAEAQTACVHGDE